MMIGMILTLAVLTAALMLYADYRLRLAASKKAGKRRADNSLGCAPRPCWYRVKDMREGGEYASQYCYWYVRAISARNAIVRVIEYGNENLCFSRSPRFQAVCYYGGRPSMPWIKVLP